MALLPLAAAVGFWAAAVACQNDDAAADSDAGPEDALDAGGESGDISRRFPPDLQVDAGVDDASHAGDTAPDEEVLVDPLPQDPREGILERWTITYDCEYTDAWVENGLHLLCAGRRPRIEACASENFLSKSSCQTTVGLPQTFSNSVDPEDPVEDFSIVPVKHNRLDDQFSLITFITESNHHLGAFVVNRANNLVTDRKIFPAPGIISGGGFIPLGDSTPFGATLFGGALLLAVYNREADSNFGNDVWGPIWVFDWLGDGTLSLRSAPERFLHPQGKSLTHFLADPASGAWVLSNSSPAHLEALRFQEEGGLIADPDQNFSIGELELEPLKMLATSPDQRTLLLASGAKLIVADLESRQNAEIDLPEEPIVSLQWHSHEGKDWAIATVSSVDVENVAGNLYVVALEAKKPVSISAPLPFYGVVPTSAAIDVSDESDCVFYQGVLLTGGHSAVTAIRCEVLERL